MIQRAQKAWWGDIIDIDNMERRWTTELEKSDGTNFIISSELLYQPNSSTDVEKLHSFLKRWFDEFLVIAYIRDPASYIVSVSIQQLKAGFCYDRLAFDIYAAIKLNKKIILPGMYNSLDEWERVFGRETLCVRRFRPNTANANDLISDFFDAAGLSFLRPQELGTVRDNEALGKNGIQLLGNLNKRYPMLDVHNRPNSLRGRENWEMLKLISRIPDEKFCVDVAWSGIEIGLANEQIRFINKYLAPDDQLQEIHVPLECSQKTRANTISSEFVTDLVNEYNIELQNRTQNKSQNFAGYYNLLLKWMRGNLNGHKIYDKLLEKGLCRVCIYGWGKIGELFYYECRECPDIDVVFVIDEKDSIAAPVKIYTPNALHLDLVDSVDTVVVTPIYDLFRIEKKMNEHGFTRLLSIEDLAW
ncbi:MAG: hypothetical protein JXR76_01650 [Deltaproteobacteria bacterium]|nr:hypothetical protein [Deltaproteobacteria bacterium]